ncbi:nematode cuticle collagen domain protein [Cooperia oncophora]
MFEEKLVVGVASACSTLAVVVVLVVVPSLYNTINEIHDQVLDGVSVFRVETDSAWTEMMDIQIAVSPPSKPRTIPSTRYSVRKGKTFLDFQLGASVYHQNQSVHLGLLDLLASLDNLVCTVFSAFIAFHFA